MEALKTQRIGNYKVVVDYDECDESPREWDELSTIYSNHRRYNPDNHKIEEVLDEDGYLNMDGKVGLMIWMFEHHNCCFKTTEIGEPNPFGDGMYARFDSGQFGIIAMSIEDAKVQWGEDWEKMAKQYMRGCIDNYNQYANGQVYFFDVIDNNGNVVDSCGGFYNIEEAFAEGVDIANMYNENDKEEIEKYLAQGTLQELKNKWYEMATAAPSWVDEVFELVEEDKAMEWLRMKLREMISIDDL